MPALRLMLAAWLCAGLFAQAPPAPQAPAQPADSQQSDTQKFRTGVEVVVAPVTVVDRDGNYVDDVQPGQFHLYDNDKEQRISVDVAFPLMSMVIAIQANDRVESILPQIQRAGSLIKPVMTGDQGEVAILAFDSRIRRMQEFTSDPAKIAAALKKIQPGSSQSRMIDAVDDAVRQLRTRPSNRRRILLLISETRDRSSEGRAREALIDAQLANVSIYTVDISRMVTSIMAPADPGRPDNRPPAMTPLPPGVPATPNTVMQATGSVGSSAQFVPLMVEIFKDVKSIFVDSPAELFAKGTGGQELGFVRQRGLEDAIQHIGAELHSQYLISYTPSNKDEGGFHQISVEVDGRKDVRARTRPGYWLAAK